MSSHRSSILVLLLLCLQALSAGQSAPAQGAEDGGTTPARTTPVPALSGLIGGDSTEAVADTDSNPPQIPELLGGPRLSLQFWSEAERSNYLQGGLNIGAAYDDNALITSTGAISNSSYSVFPNLTVEQTFARMRWKLNYAAGLTVNQALTNQNQGSHDLSFDSQFELSPHVNLRVAEDFHLITGFFDSGVGEGSIDGGGGPNAGLITPIARQRSSSTVAQLDYHFALKDVVGVSGSFYDLHFSQVPVEFTLTNTRSAGGSAYWLHRLFGRDWAGLSYRFQRFTFDPSSGDTQVHSVLIVNTISLPGRFALTGFVGPQYSNSLGVFTGGGGTEVVRTGGWSVAGGVELGWQKQHTSIAAGYSRLINDGGGVLSVVHSHNVHGALRQELRPAWAVTIAASYGDNQSLTGPFSSASSVRTASVSTSLERNIRKSLRVGLGYTHDFQDQTQSTDSVLQGSANRNRLFVMLGYQWARPLGR